MTLVDGSINVSPSSEHRSSTGVEDRELVKSKDSDGARLAMKMGDKVSERGSPDVIRVLSGATDRILLQSRPTRLSAGESALTVDVAPRSLGGFGRRVTRGCVASGDRSSRSVPCFDRTPFGHRARRAPRQTRRGRALPRAQHLVTPILSKVVSSGKPGWGSRRAPSHDHRRSGRSLQSQGR